MELKLYNYLRTAGLTNEVVDFREKNWQNKLEAYHQKLGLDNDILSSINKHLKTYNTFLKSEQKAEVRLRYYQILSLYFSALYFKKRSDRRFIYSQNSLAYWMATGSGKTIIMHLNILQYLDECENFKDFELIMTTPGVNLIEQHKRELIPFIAFLNRTQFRHKIRLTIDTTQALTNKANDFFVYPASKTYKRLILVDEAHIGLSTSGTKGTDGAFMELRRKLNINDSFLFEYSATFHNINRTLEKEYEKSIVYDYNYNLFYKDGYGKDYFFQRIGDDVLEKSFDDNLHRNLQVINEKIELWSTWNKAIFEATTFPDKPLIAFMGNTVNNKDKSAKNEDPEVSDITSIINFLAHLSEAEKSNYQHIFNNEYHGKLTLTRNPEVDDEILLSYGNGGYWGIVNVGNGAKFIYDLDNENVVKNPRDKVIVSNIEKYSFANIDLPNSPINVLIGSRKFAEGWNCYRVSVIGLINLGRSKGNKIIQIFGRGVRIKGIKNDGKRTFPEHNEDYFQLCNHKEDEKLRKMETLCVFSLKKSYLETFTHAVNKELEIQKQFEIRANPSIIQPDDNTDTKFEEPRKQSPIFKLLQPEMGQGRIILKENATFDIHYKNLDKTKIRTVNNFKIKVDYRPDREKEGINIKGSLVCFLNQFNGFIDTNEFDNILNTFQEDNALYISQNRQRLTPFVILDFTDEIIYKSELDTSDIDFIQILVIRLSTDFLKKLKNKVDAYI